MLEKEEGGNEQGKEEDGYSAIVEGKRYLRPFAVRKGIGRGIVPIYLPIKVLQKSRNLSKDEVVLRLSNGKVVAAEAVGIINLVVSDRVRMKRLVDSKSLEIDNLDNLPACESCLKGKMTRKPFVGQSKLANGLLDLIHIDVCGPLNTQAGGRFSYFITFTDDHSRYGYVYLIMYMSEAFLRFKEFRLEVENQTGRKIKTLWSDRGGEYLSGEFIYYLKENGIVSQWTPPGMLQLNGMTERRNRTLLDMIRSMMSFTELPLSFWVMHLRRQLGIQCSWKEVFQRIPDVMICSLRNEVRHQWKAGTSFASTVSTNNVPILRRSVRLPQPLERYGFLGVTGHLDNDPTTYGEAMLNIDSGK
ncbi:UNVERIFIED_CONTAM: Retrovirus-related Pol polyprotein from transposon TNT 1-94 [Sesamum calycinum]|uniref:Retrovirus-related Pol polyprotein from transposon TNT 1-94 n=1 Tax=Sesamum calycinum TaxID=2727403 RepID=A0AAW2IXE5_9LAMI